jgi:hypothetical protein
MILQMIFCLFMLPAMGLGASFSAGSLSWDAQTQSFSGRFLYALPDAAESPTQNSAFDEFWLLPNRDLARQEGSLDLSRELREFRTARTEDEWPFPESGLGALVIAAVATGKAYGHCPDTEEKLKTAIAQIKFADTGFQFTDDERVLRVAKPVHVINFKDHSVNRNRCRFIKISFDFYPRLANGNFALRVDGGAVFSGPVYPVWRELPLKTSLRVESTGVADVISCASCKPLAKNDAGVMFTGLPPPIYILRTDPPDFVIFKNLKTVNVSEGGQDLKELGALQETLSEFGDAFAPAIQAAPEWQLKISRGLPIERLLLEQLDEIQLHASFGQVNPLLGRYHKAALFRALGRSFARHLLRKDSAESEWARIRRNETTARILAELWLRNWFPNLFTLKNISDRFSFIPFFRAVQQGSAFVNNSVFIGGEEGAGNLDYSVIEDFLSPFKGADLLSRMNDCLEADQQRDLQSAAADVQKARRTAGEFQTFLASMKPKSDCISKMETGIIPAWVPEEKIEIHEGTKGRLVLSREYLRSSLSNDFFFGRVSETEHQKLRIQLAQREKQKEIVLLSTAKSKTQETELPQGTESAAVLFPHRAVSQDRLQFPRPLRTVLQAFALNYDSRRSDFTMRSQFQTNQVGDDWGRTLTLGLRREYSSNFFDFQMSSRIPSLIRATNTTVSLSSNTRLVEAPPSFLAVSYNVDYGGGSLLYPEGIGLRITLRRPLTLSAFREDIREPQQEWQLTSAVPLAARLTWIENITYARSDSDVDAGLRSVPGWPASTFQSREYVVLRSELRNTVTQNLNASLAQSILFQHALFYAAHVLAVDDLDAERTGSVNARTAQSVLTGVRFLGAFFGAKDQSLGFEVARVLSRPVFTSVGFFIGKSLN